MQDKKYSLIIVDRLEYYLTKEIEKALYSGESDKCYSALYQRLLECINARKELNYQPIPNNVKELLWDYGYDEAFIDSFITKSQSHSEKDCPG